MSRRLELQTLQLILTQFPQDPVLYSTGKKRFLFFHPNRLMDWSSGRNEGNPTRSIEINNLIKRVKKKEVRKQGVASQT
jgi:hypothetical protein